MSTREFGLLMEGVRTLCMDTKKFLDNKEKWVLYIDLIRYWGRRISLLSKEDLDNRIPHHIVDSLLLSQFIPEGAILMDIGTGAGFPGVPVAIYRDDINVILVESKLKKGTFLRYVKHQLQLENIKVLISRWEELKDIKVDIVVTRATGFTEVEFNKMKNFLKEGGRIFRYSTRTLIGTISHRLRNPLREEDFYILEYR